MKLKRITSLLLSLVIMLGAFTAQTAFAKTGEPCTDYFITSKQETELNKVVNTIVSDLNLKSKSLSSLEKTRRIYNFLCSSTTYDYTTLNNSSYNLKYTAYATLVNGTSVCNGYAEAFDILAKKAGLSTAIVMSYNHAWNIVKIGGKYYNIDATWDAYNNKYYTYFLESNSDFENCKKSASHKRKDEYKTAAFNKKYPMASKSYYGGKDVKISNCSHRHKKSLYTRKSTCKVSSYGGGKLCKDCGLVTGCGKRGAKLSCKKEWVVTYQPSCFHTGTKKYMCVYCGKTDKTKTLAKTHKFEADRNPCEGYKCMRCTHCYVIKKGTKEKIAKKHNFVYSRTIEKPTCSKLGLDYYVCKDCHRAAEMRNTPKLAHKSDKGTVTLKPTATKDGVKEYRCTVCKEVIKTEKIPATGTPVTETASVEFTSSKWDNENKNRTLRWNALSGYQYEIYCSQSTDFTGVTPYVPNPGITACTHLCKSDKTYYYKIRAFKTVDGKKVYTPFSKVRCCYVKDGKGYYKTL